MAKAKKTKPGKTQHTWKVVRMNNQSDIVTADALNVVDGDLVFSTDGVTTRVIAANTYTDVELAGEAVETDVAASVFPRNRPKAQTR